MIFIKIGYAMVVVTLLLMIWASLSRARELHIDTSVTYPPCFFNPLCSCSKVVPDLGIVQCKSVPLFRIPPPINNSKVFMLHLDNNGLRELEPYFFQSTGLYRLAINKNPLQEIPDEAFLGLERSLWELELHENKLITVPNRALRYLQKLKLLDLTGNEITDITQDSWRGLENSLQTLILADNSISSLPPDGFSTLPLLEILDLHGNHLTRIDANVFRDGMVRLQKIYLQDNQLTAIPYEELSPLRQLRYLDLSSNIINSVTPTIDLHGVHLSLDMLRLENNVVPYLLPGSFKYFSVVNTTILDGNRIKFIREDAFRNSRIKTLSLRHCGLFDVSPSAFGGLEATLQSLDLSGNNISNLPKSIFHQFDNLRNLNLRDNKVDNVVPGESFNGFQYTLFNLDLSGRSNGATSLQDLRRMRSLRTLTLSRLFRKSLNPDDFLEFGVDLEELKIYGGQIKKIQAHAFKNVRTIKVLDLSENQLDDIDNDAFVELGHSLLTLKLTNAFSDSVRNLPHDALKPLSQLEFLDVSNNRLSTLPDTSFHFLGNLKRLELQDNMINVLHKGTLQGDIHSSLETVFFSLNRLQKIVQHTFVELPALKEISLEDNVIENIERRSFMNLDRLKTISLKGNKLLDISDEAFQNLPVLEHLDLSYNDLDSFHFSMFDQVGTLASLMVNASNNRITRLSDSIAAAFGSIIREPGMGMTNYVSNIKVLDLSRNNISSVSRSYFRSVELSLTHLYMSHNKLLNISRDVFGSFPHLQWLDLSKNDIMMMEFDAFRNTKRLQILSLSDNRLLEVAPEILHGLKSLRIIELADNDLKSLPDNLFSEEGLERLDLSNNDFSRIPTNAFSIGAAMTLVQMDLSGNCIPAIGNADFVQKFNTDTYLEEVANTNDWQRQDWDYNKDFVYHSVRRPNSKVIHQRQNSPAETLFKSLSWLDLSGNKLMRIEAGSFGSLQRLRWLNLGHNALLSLERGTGTFRGLERKLWHLGLENASLSVVPSLAISELRSLDLSNNNLPTVPPDTAINLTQLRHLDLSHNDLTTVPIVMHSLPRLKSLSLAGNPISTLTNTSLLGVADTLEILDISGLRLNFVETGIIGKMQCLRTLKTTAYTKVRDFNLPTLLAYNSGLKNLWIEVDDDKTNLGIEMFGQFPCKLRNITFSGTALRQVSDNVLKGVHSTYLRFVLFNTSVTSLSHNIFANPGRVRNLSLDLRHNRLSSIGNPNTAQWPGIPKTMFLNDIELSDNPLNCDCEMGWLEAWDRKRRQFLCNDVVGDTCMTTTADFRLAKCDNKENRTLIDVLKNDIECGWGGASSVFPSKHILYIAGGAIATLLYL